MAVTNTLCVQDEGEASLHSDRKFFNLLAKIRRRDHSLYAPRDEQAVDSAHSSSSSSEDEAKPTARKAKASRPAYLKDVLARQASL